MSTILSLLRGDAHGIFIGVGGCGQIESARTKGLMSLHLDFEEPHDSSSGVRTGITEYLY